MKKKATELEFISRINRDGSGVEKVSDDLKKEIEENPLMRDTACQ